MGKAKHIYCIFLIITIISIFHPCVFGQNHLTKEQEKGIKVSGKYYFGEGSDFDMETARQNALVDLTNQIISAKILQLQKSNEVLKNIEIHAHIDHLEQKGKIKIMAWIAKDSVLTTTNTPLIREQKTEQQKATNPTESIVTPTIKEELPLPTKPKTATTNDIIIKELVECKTYNDVMRIARPHGFVFGRNSSTGFQHPEQCIVAVFTSDGVLSALLDKGSDSRNDLLSGKTVQNPEQYYNQQKGYNLLWMQNVNN